MKRLLAGVLTAAALFVMPSTASADRPDFWGVNCADKEIGIIYITVVSDPRDIREAREACRTYPELDPLLDTRPAGVEPIRLGG